MNINLKDIVILDFEASGLSDDSYPIEFGIATNEVVSSALIKPHSSWNHWSDDAEKIHNIKRETLFDDGIERLEAIKTIKALTENKYVFSDNPRYETMWLNKLLESESLNFQLNIYNLYELDFDLQTYSDYIHTNKCNYTLHRAGDDANLIRKALIHSLEKGFKI